MLSSGESYTDFYHMCKYYQGVNPQYGNKLLELEKNDLLEL